MNALWADGAMNEVNTRRTVLCLLAASALGICAIISSQLRISRDVDRSPFPVPDGVRDSPVPTRHELSAQQKVRQHELLTPICNAYTRDAHSLDDMEGELAAQHSELLSLADMTSRDGDTDWYYFDLHCDRTDFEMPDGFGIDIVDGNIVRTMFFFPAV